jgi:hypothetical protein
MALRLGGFGMRPTDLQVDEQYLSAAVSGSFHRHMEAITAAVHELASRSIRVLSPADPRFVAQQGEFLFVASDRVRSVRLVQDRHLESIRAADFLWLVCPDGYVGQSASMEIGFAAAIGVPIVATHAPSDLTLQQYVTTMPTFGEALQMVAANSRPRRKQGTHASVEEAHHILERINAVFTRSSRVDEPACCVRGEMAELGSTLRMPTFA